MTGVNPRKLSESIAVERSDSSLHEGLPMGRSFERCGFDRRSKRSNTRIQQVLRAITIGKIEVLVQISIRDKSRKQDNRDRDNRILYHSPGTPPPPPHRAQTARWGPRP